MPKAKEVILPGDIWGIIGGIINVVFEYYN